MKNRVEEKLLKVKEEINRLEVPSDFNEMIYNKIEKNRMSKWKPLASKPRILMSIFILFIVLLFGYSYDSIAYVKYKLDGYETVATGSLSEILKDNQGQIIDKSVELSNGTIVTLEGIILNENHMYLLVDSYHPISIWENVHHSRFFSLRGIKAYHSWSGTFKIINQHTEKGYMTFEVPEFYEKWMALKVYDQSTDSVKEIRFTLNRREAYIPTIKYKLDKTIKENDYELNFKNMNISYGEIFLEGNVKFRNDEAYQLLNIREYMPHIQFDLYLNDILVEGSLSNSGKQTYKSNEIEIDFTMNYYYPGEINSIKIKNIAFGVSKRLFQEVVINLGYTEEQALPNLKYNGFSILEAQDNVIVNDEIKITEIKNENGKTTLRINTQEEIMMSLKNAKTWELIEYSVDKEQFVDHYEYTVIYDNPVDNVRLYFDQIGSFQEIEESYKILE